MGDTKQAGPANQIEKPVTVADGTSQRTPMPPPGIFGFETPPFSTFGRQLLNPNMCLVDYHATWQDFLQAGTSPSGGGSGPASSQTTTNGMTAGQNLTYEQEGERLDPYHPTAESGVTIAVGYDMKERSKEGITTDLTTAGVPKADAEILAGGATLSGKDADDFVKKNSKTTITKAQSQALYKTVYADKEAYTKKLATKKDVTDKYGTTDWDKLDQKIKDVLIDMTFRGDYTGGVREKIQKSVVDNDPTAFKTAISVKANFTSNLSQKRFQARVDHMN